MEGIFSWLSNFNSNHTHKPVSNHEMARISIPPFKDQYTDYVRKLEAGNTVIDYTAFRNSFLDSEQFEVKSNNEEQFDELRNDVIAAAGRSDFKRIAKATKAMLGIDYTSMFAHNFLQRTYSKFGDASMSKKHQDIAHGLLNSITTSGDGLSFATAWQVTQVEEEYFILDVLGVALREHCVARSNGNIYDRMDVSSRHGNQTFFFSVNKMFAH